MMGSRGRHEPRSRDGCTTCLIRKVKCDKKSPQCQKCITADVQCSWDRNARKEYQGLRVKQYRIARSRLTGNKDNTHARSISRQANPRIVPRGVNPSLEESVEVVRPTSFSPAAISDSLPQFCHDLPLDLQLAFTSWSSHPVIPNTLTTDHIPMANSLALSPEERSLIDFFPHSCQVYRFGKSFQWSNFKYLQQHKAADDPLVMNSLLAFCASEVHRKQSPDSLVMYSKGDYGANYYNQALQKLRVALGNLNTSTSTLESMVSSIFLLISYETKFGSSLFNLQLHLDGIRSFLAKYLQPTLIERLSSADQDVLHGPGITPFCAQVLLWIAYIDASGVRGLTTFRFYDFLDHDPTSCLHLDSLFPHARSSYRILYGESYPADQVQDDFENYRPLEMVHYNLRFRRRIWRVADAEEDMKPCHDSTRAILDDLIAFDKKYADLMSEHLVTAAYKGHRVVDSVRAAVSSHYANLILHRLLLTPSRPPLPMQSDALSKLLNIVHKVSNATKCGVMIGWPWEPLIAGIETEDAIYRDWLRSYLKASISLGKEFVWAGLVLEEVERMRTRGEQIGGASRIRQLLHSCIM